MITLTLPGSIRSKKNSKRIIRAGKFPKIVPSKAYKEWEERARLESRYQLPQWHFPIFYMGNVWAKITIYYKGQQPDLSGCLESVGDCLEGIVWANDSQIKSWDGSRLIHDKDNPRTVVEVRGINESKI